MPRPLAVEVSPRPEDACGTVQDNDDANDVVFLSADALTTQREMPSSSDALPFTIPPVVRDTHVLLSDSSGRVRVPEGSAVSIWYETGTFETEKYCEYKRVWKPFVTVLLETTRTITLSCASGRPEIHPNYIGDVDKFKVTVPEAGGRPQELTIHAAETSIGGHRYSDSWTGSHATATLVMGACNTAFSMMPRVLSVCIDDGNLSVTFTTEPYAIPGGAGPMPPPRTYGYESETFSEWEKRERYRKEFTAWTKRRDEYVQEQLFLITLGLQLAEMPSGCAVDDAEIERVREVEHSRRRSRLEDTPSWYLQQWRNKEKREQDERWELLKQRAAERDATAAECRAAPQSEAEWSTEAECRAAPQSETGPTSLA